MTFASIEFLIFFVIVLVVLALIQHAGVNPAAGGQQGMFSPRRRSAGHLLLLIASYVFYGWWDWRFLFLLFGVTFVAWITASHVKWKLVLGVIVPLVALGIFKYFNFFVGSFCTLFGMEQTGGINIILPVGISFYTFQALSYTIDVYRGKLERENNFVRFALYISFFPQLVAGPIVKASEFLPQLKEDRRVTKANLAAGIQIFVFGMFKKLVIADNLSVFVDEVFRVPEMFHWATVLLAVVSYALQIYMDFSGYSDMAIGCAKIMGYDLRKNFNMPYISRNVTEFWKRWHISLSSWLQEYLYISLGGNRKGKGRTYLNLLITMVLGGLWHGANWTFVLWGAMHGVALCIHKLFRKVMGSKHPDPKAHWLIKGISILCTDVFVFFCWIFFRAEHVSQAWHVIRQIITFQDGVRHIYTWAVVGILLIAVATIIGMVRSRKQASWEGCYPLMNLHRYLPLVFLFLEMGLIVGLAYVGSNPFIYFQF